jgi:transcriptional regulator with XRE-family HTH domain
LDLGIRVKEWRDKRGFTQEELATKSEVTQGMIYKIEKGLTVPSIPVVQRIAAALNIPVSLLIEPNIDILGEAIEIKELLGETDKETREFLTPANKDYIILAKDIKKSEVPLEDVKAALEIIEKYKRSKNK